MLKQQLLCAISYSSKRLGAALYDEDEREVKIMLDIAEDDDFVILGRLLREHKPTHIIANRSQDSQFQYFLRKECNHLMLNLTDFGYENSDKDESILTASETSDQKQKQPVSTSSMNQTQTQLVTSTPLNSTGRNSHASTPSLQTNKKEQPEEEDEGKIWRPSIIFLPDIAFSFGLAKKRIEQTFGFPTAGDELNSRLKISFRFDFSSTNMIRSLGALLRFIEQQKAGHQEKKDTTGKNAKKGVDSILNVSGYIDTVNIYFLPECIEVDSTTVRALEIFYSEYTPQSSIRRKFIWGNNRREGMSVFNLCNLCRTTPGKQMLRMWFERPTKDMDVLTERHDAIAFLYHDCNLEVTTFLRNLVKDVTSVKGVYRRMRRGNLPISDWKNLFKTICTLVKIGEYLNEREVNLAILKVKLNNAFGSKLKEIASMLIEVIDFQETFAENRLSIQKGIDDQLDKLKELYDRLPVELTSVAQAETEDLRIEGCTVAYVPIIGYLLMVPQLTKIPQNVTQLIELVFVSEEMAYYKTKRMRMLDENLGDVKMAIVDAETNVVLNLQKQLLECRHPVLEAVELAATLDSLISLAAVARQYNWVRPKFVEESVLAIEQARHPIAEHLVKTNHEFIPNPIISSNELGKVKVLFGPNASGKSVYLKMVGLVVYMAHVGCFVPAQRAVIGPINRIMSRLYTVDSVLDGMSSFANDLKQMSRAISRSDEHSLLIVDEFGKGTMTEVGLSLLASCLNYWLDNPEHCPHAMVASHFHALPELIRDPHKLVRYQTMGVSRQDDDNLYFHFNLMDGYTDLSYATFTAFKMGISRDVIRRSEEIYIHLRTGGTLSELEPIEIPKVKTHKEKQKDHQPDRNDQQQQFEEEEDIDDDDAVNVNDEEDPYEEGGIAVESCSVTVATITDEDDEEARADGVDLTDEEAGTGSINDGAEAGGFDNSGLNLTTLW